MPSSQARFRRDMVGDLLKPRRAASRERACRVSPGLGHRRNRIQHEHYTDPAATGRGEMPSFATTHPLGTSTAHLVHFLQIALTPGPGWFILALLHSPWLMQFAEAPAPVRGSGATHIQSGGPTRP